MIVKNKKITKPSVQKNRGSEQNLLTSEIIAGTAECDSCSLGNTKKRWIAQLIIFVLAFGLYANTIPFGYVFDDPIVITQNNFTKKGFAGIPKMLTTDSFAGIFGEHGGIIEGGRYRPLSLITFAVEYEFFGESPKITHAINVLMYALTCMLIFSILYKLFSFNGIYRIRWLAPFCNARWFVSIPFVATVLFAAHPIHTEVVANIKERDDIMALLAASGSLWLMMRYFETQKYHFTIWAAVVFFLGLMSKENTITYLAVIPLTLFTFTAVKPMRYIKPMLPVVLASVGYIILRQLVLGEAANNNIPEKLMNDPFLEATFGQKYATIVYTLGLYLKLMFIPHPLTVDYYPYHIELVNWFDFRAIIPLLIYGGLTYYTIKTIKDKNLFAYLFVFFAATLSLFSNILFPIGTFMTERFLYIPVLAATIALPYLLLYKIPEWVKPLNSEKLPLYRNAIAVVLLVVVGLYSAKTVARNMDWKDDFTLFKRAVEVSPKSAKSNHVMGELYMLKARAEKDSLVRDSLYDLSIKYSKIGVDIHAQYVRCLHNLGAALFERTPKNTDTALYYFVRTIESQAYYPDALNYIIRILNDPSLPVSVDKKINVMKEVRLYQTDMAKYPNSPASYEVNSNLGTYYLLRHQEKIQATDLDSAFIFLELATRVQSDKPKSSDYNNLGVVFNRKGDLRSSAQWLEKAVAAAPTNAQYVLNLSRTYAMLNDTAAANKYMAMYQQLTGTQ